MVPPPLHFHDDPALGQTASVIKTITEADIRHVASLNADTNPVDLGATLTAPVELMGKLPHHHIRLRMLCGVIGTPVISGEALVKVPPRAT